MCIRDSSTPDLRGKFVVGYSNTDSDYDVGDAGGSKQVTLSTSQLPSHNHTASTNTASLTGTATYVAETWAGSGQASGIFGKNGGYSAYYTPSGVDSSPTGQLTIDASHSHSVTVNNTGSGGAIENRPPYYSLCYIMKT